MNLEYKGGSGITWSNGAKRSSFYGVPPSVLLVGLAWLMIPPFKLLYALICLGGILYLHYKKLTYKEFIGCTKTVVTRGKQTIATKREIQRRRFFY